MSQRRVEGTEAEERDNGDGGRWSHTGTQTLPVHVTMASEEREEVEVTTGGKRRLLSLPCGQEALKRMRVALTRQIGNEVEHRRRERNLITMRLELCTRQLHELLRFHFDWQRQSMDDDRVIQQARRLLFDCHRGQFYQLSCPICKRYDFVDATALLVHCSTVHQTRFHSMDTALSACGRPVPESRVPAEHPCRSSTRPLLFRSLAAQWLVHLKAHEHRIGVPQPTVTATWKTRAEDASEYASDEPQLTPALLAQGATEEDTWGVDTLARQLAGHSNTDAKGDDNDDEDDDCEPEAQGKHTGYSTTTTNSNTRTEIDPRWPTTRTFGTALESEAQMAVEYHNQTSRFHVRKLVVVGSNARRTTQGEHTRDTQDSNSGEADDNVVTPITHKWSLYLRGTDVEQDIDAWVAKVRFFLHPSYAPNDIVDVTEPPFRIARHGWGDFNTRLQIHFVDPRNKPINLYHDVLLNHPVHESPYILELDKQWFLDRNLLPSPPSTDDAHTDHDHDDHDGHTHAGQHHTSSSSSSSSFFDAADLATMASLAASE